MADDPAALLAALAALAGPPGAEGATESADDPAAALPRAGQFYAEAVIQPAQIGAAGLSAVHAGQRSTDPATGQRCLGVSPGALSASLRALMDAALAPGAGLDVIERHLLASSVVLGNAAMLWLTCSTKAHGLEQMDVYARLALKATEQQRKTLATLAHVRHPRRVAFIKQVNAARQQVVNNGGRPAQTENFLARAANGLLEVLPGERLDGGTQKQAGGVDPHLEALDPLYRPEDAGG